MLETYIESKQLKYNNLSISDFHHHLKIEFADNSNAFFYYAFYLIAEDLKEVAIFTEHCGYHIFPFIDSKIELFDFSGNIIKTENYKI